MAYRLGNKNSLLTILDANITTLIAAIILFIFGESTVKGFAMMLMISIAVTLFVMVFLVRYITTKFVETNQFNEKIKLFIGNVKEPNWIHKIDYVKHRFKFISVAVIIFIVGMISMCINKLNLGIEFKGGTSITMDTTTEVTEEQIKEDMNELKLEFESYSKETDTTYTIIVSDTLEEEAVLNSRCWCCIKQSKTRLSKKCNIFTYLSSRRNYSLCIHSLYI
jgi:SecD/SecF fusion protein